MQKQPASPAMVIIGALVLIAIVSGLWWKMLGPGAQDGHHHVPPPPGAPGGGAVTAPHEHSH